MAVVEPVEVVEGGKAASLDVEAFQKFFNSEIDKHNSQIPHIRSVQGKRKAALQARLREHGREALAEVVRKAVQSNFLNGGGNKSFIATFDWLMSPNNFPKVLEGNYDNRTNNPNNKPYGTTNSQSSKAQREAELYQHVCNKLAGDIPEPSVPHDWH